MIQDIRFSFRYRDSGNYKKFGHKDFSNPTNLSIDEIEIQLRKYLIDSEYFYPEKVGIPKFRFHRYWDDYSWYEMENIELVESRNRKESILDFIQKLVQYNQ